MASVFHPVLGHQACRMRIESNRQPQTALSAISQICILEQEIEHHHADREDVQAVKEITAELAVGHHLFQIAIGCGHKP
jgi:hypothetical protein